jgi:crotonobetainyl-CoA:carnitine CoA-transferase CaiB-like acyl-CoA transferase
MSGALRGIKILDLSRVLAGPVCTQVLGDLGAEVIKIEKPGAGDDTRFWGPPFLKDKSGKDTKESAYYLSANRNKKSVAVDIAKPEGQKIVDALLAQCDVLIENFKTGGLKKYGLDFESIKRKHPHIIYCSITGFGQNGPMAGEPGYDFLAQGMAGLMAATGAPDGEPTKAGVALSDVMTGLYAAIGILAALRAREKNGQGQHIDLSLVDCTLASMVNIAQYYLTSGKTAPRLGNAHSTIVPYQNFEAADGYIIIAIGNDTQFHRFCDVVGKPDWATDKKFQTNVARVTNRDELVPMIAAIIKAKTMEDWIGKFREVDVPCGPVNTMDLVFAEEQVKIREMEIAMNHAQADGIKLVGSPLKLSETPVEYKNAPPVLGQHTAEVLQKLLGMGKEEIAGLVKKGVLQADL